MSEMWRVFAAVDLPPDVRQQIGETAGLLADRGWKGRWVKPEKSHMTVRFYGDTATELLPRLQDELRDAIAMVPEFAVVVTGAGSFPDSRRPRVIWLGVDDPSGQLTPLKLAVERASGRAGLEAETGPYKPHLTVGRLHPRFRINGTEAEDGLAQASSFKPIPMRVSDVVLIRSQLGRGGSQYTTVDQFPLGEPSPKQDGDTS